MITIRKRQNGVTLFEVLIVLVIGSMLLYLSIQQYFVYKRGADVSQLESTVNSIFQAMSSFYKGNCYGSYNPSTKTMSWDPMHPNAIGAATLYTIDIPTQIQPFLAGPIPRSPLVNNTGGGTGGFVAQFNRVNYTSYFCVRAATGVTASGPDTSMGCASGAADIKGTVVMWRAQVAISLANPAEGQRLKARTDATCLSNLAASGTSVTPCSSSPGTGNFLVWERQSIYASPRTTSSYWPTNPVVSQFTQMYRESPIDYLLSVSHSPEIQYYTCGG